MKRIKFRMTMLFALLLPLMLAFGCAQETVVFTGTIEEVGENSILVTTEDLNASDRASVGYDKSLRMDFTPEAGQTVKITILPEIRESYPVQVTAVRIELVSADSGDNTDSTGVPAASDEIETEETKGVYAKISPDEYMELLDSGKSLVLVDVRTEEEYAEGHIENAVLLTDAEIPEKAESVLPDKSQTIVVYCRSGRRSAASANVLIDMGYTNVLDLGGIIDWPYEVVK